MSNTSSTCIMIGGTIAESDLAKFVEPLLERRVGKNFNHYFDDPYDLWDYLRAAQAENRPACFFESEAKSGKFPLIEEACRACGLSYARSTGGQHSWSLVYWEPGMAEAREWTGCVDDHVPRLSYGQIETLLKTAGALAAELAVMRKASPFTKPFIIATSTPRARLPASPGQISALDKWGLYRLWRGVQLHLDRFRLWISGASTSCGMPLSVHHAGRA
jgi:hypothetical protein